MASALGDQAYLIAILLWAKQTTESGTIVGIVMFAGGITGLLMPLGGVLADRLPRVKSLVILDALSGICVLVLAALFFTLPDHYSVLIPAVLTINFLRGICTALFHPVTNALLPDLVDEARLLRANAMLQTTLRITTLIGQSVSGLLFRLLGAPLLLLIDGVSFLISAFTEMFIREPPREECRESRKNLSLWQDLKAGFRFTGRMRGFRAYLLEASCANFFVAALFVSLPFYVEDVLQASSDWYGYLLGAMGLGAVLGGIIAGRFRQPGAARGTIHLVCIVCLNGSLLPLALARTPWAALPMIIVGWSCAGFHQVILTTLVQKRTPQSMRGRVFGLLTMIRTGLTPISIAIFGILIDRLKGQVTGILFWAGAAGLVIGLGALFHPGFRWFFTGDEKEITPD